VKRPAPATSSSSSAPSSMVTSSSIEMTSQSQLLPNNQYSSSSHVSHVPEPQHSGGGGVALPPVSCFSMLRNFRENVFIYISVFNIIDKWLIDFLLKREKNDYWRHLHNKFPAICKPTDLRTSSLAIRALLNIKLSVNFTWMITSHIVNEAPGDLCI